MRKYLSFTLLLTSLLFSCSKTEEQTINQDAQPEPSTGIEQEATLPSADYSSLFSDFSCTMSSAEVAQALDVPESDIRIPDYKRATGCSFVVAGFGINGLGDETIVEWFLEKATKEEVKKEIQNYTEAHNTNSSAGLSVETSTTGDTILAKSPSYGRVIVFNEHHENWLLINYSPRRVYNTRTEEQHMALGGKMIDLANYLLTKNRK